METPSVELKEWLDPTDANARAIIAKGILAHANSGGGFIVIGFYKDNPVCYTVIRCV